MEPSNLANDELGRGVISAPSNANTPTIKIDSICIDLSHAIDKPKMKSCEHFSIRGFVSEIRKKDSKICWPISVGNSIEGQTCVLPPLLAPKFRWWSCQNCLSAKGEFRESDIQQVKDNDGRKYVCNNLKDVDGSGNNVHLFSNKLENKVDIEAAAIRGHSNSFEDVLNHKFPRRTHGPHEFLPSLTGKVGADDTAIKTPISGYVDFHKSGSGSHGDVQPGFSIRNLRGMVDGSGEGIQTQKHTHADSQQKQAIVACGTPKEVSLKEKAFHGTAKDHVSRHISLETNDHDNALSDHEANDILDEHSGNPGGLHCRKTQKVRLLTELLGAKNSKDGNRIKKTQSKVLPTSTVNSISVVADNVVRGKPSSKRKASQDEEWWPPNILPPKKGKKNVQFCKGDTESASMKNATGDSPKLSKKKLGLSEDVSEHAHPTVANFELEKSTPAMLCFSTDTKGENSKQKTDTNTIQSKKKFRKTQVGERCTVLGPPEHLLLMDHTDFGDADEDDHNDDQFMCGVLDGTEKGHVYGNSSLQSSMRSQLCKKKKKKKKKKKIHIPKDEHTSIAPYNYRMVNECINTQEALCISNMGPQSTPCLSNIANIKEGFHLSFEDSVGALGNERGYLSHVEDAQDVLLPQQSILWKHQIKGKTFNDKYIGNPSALTASSDLSALNIANRIYFSSKMGKCTSQAEGSRVPLVQRKDYSSTCSNVRPAGPQAHIDNAMNHHRAEKLIEQRKSDDIPMEIIELLAKNRYERCLQDARDDRSLSESANNTRNTGNLIDFARSSRNGELVSLQEKSPLFHTIQSNNARHAPKAMDKNEEPIDRDSVRCFSHDQSLFTMNQLKEAPASTSYIPLLERQGMQSNGVHFSGAGSSGGVQNNRYNGDVVGPRLPYTSSQASEPYTICHNVAVKHDQASQARSTMMSNKVYVGHNNLQKSPTKSANKEMLSHYPTEPRSAQLNRHGLSIMDMKCSSSKQNRNLTFEGHQVHAEQPSSCKDNDIDLHSRTERSSDLYPSEAVSAMHLLSLMDAGLHPNSGFSMDENKTLAKKLTSCHDKPEELPHLGKGSCKTNASSSQFHTGNQPVQRSSRCVHTVPTASSCASFMNNSDHKGPSDLAAQTPMERKQPKAKRGRPRKYPPTTGGITTKPPAKKRGRPRKYEAKSCGSAPNQKHVPNCGTQKKLIGESISVALPLQYHDFTKHVRQNPQSNSRRLLLKNNAETKICSMNKNPADFSVPEAGNVYTIGAEDLISWNAGPSRDRSDSTNLRHTTYRILGSLLQEKATQ